jgi:hypothetical protein
VKAKTLSLTINLMPPGKSRCWSTPKPRYLFTVMALLGQRLTHTPHLVHVTTAITCGFRFLPSSKAPCGQIPMQICPVHGPHFVRSIVIGDLRLSIWNQQLNKRQRYICCEQRD